MLIIKKLKNDYHRTFRLKFRLVRKSHGPHNQIQMYIHQKDDLFYEKSYACHQLHVAILLF